MPSAIAPALSSNSSTPASAADPVPAAGADAIDGGFGLYIHWPFCRSKCPYCDFNSHVRNAVDQPRWARALLAELAHFAARTPGRRLNSIFFGGGTPSLMPPSTVAALIEAAAKHWRFADDIEITLEANPTSAEAAAFQGFRTAGVGRLSLGVQSFDDRALRFLGRGHDAAEATAAIALARRHFTRLSFDLIYARPGQSDAEWTAELDHAIDLAADHLSLYQLTIEENTGFYGAVRRGQFTPLDEETAARLFELTQERCAAAGLPAYEISNHAAPGSECRHNLVYWRYGDYVGIGPGAHGRLSDGAARHATRQLRKPEAWLEQVEARGAGTEATEALSPAVQAEEALMMGLRLREGVVISRLERLSGQPFAALIPPPRLHRLLDAGFLRQADGRLIATAAGRTVLNTVLADLLA